LVVDGWGLKNPDFFCGEEIVPSWFDVLATDIFFFLISARPWRELLSKLARCLERKDLLLDYTSLLVIAVF